MLNKVEMNKRKIVTLAKSGNDLKIMDTRRLMLLIELMLRKGRKTPLTGPLKRRTGCRREP